jgi:branched-chain amino acid transport system ATP-binding protein
MDNNQLIQLKDISVHYGGVKALEKATLHLSRGEIVALMGPNGAGKSTILKAIFGLAPLSSGQTLWRDQPINPIPCQLGKLGIAFVPQGRRVFNNLTVKENVEIGVIRIKDKKELQRRMEQTQKLFPLIKIKEKLLAGNLSGGEQQMVAVARALMAEPEILLLDEPSLGLSPIMVKDVFVKIKEINQTRNVSILVAEHNILSVLEIADRIYVLDKGIVIHQSNSANFDSAILEKIFLGN